MYYSFQYSNHFLNTQFSNMSANSQCRTHVSNLLFLQPPFRHYFIFLHPCGLYGLKLRLGDRIIILLIHGSKILVLGEVDKGYFRHFLGSRVDA